MVKDRLVNIFSRVCFLSITHQNPNHYEKKETTDRATRLAYRNALIQGVFYELTATENYSFTQAYIMLGFFFGLNDRQLRKILLLKPKVALSADDLAKLTVILQRLSKKKADKSIRRSRSLEACLEKESR